MRRHLLTLAAALLAAAATAGFSLADDRAGAGGERSAARAAGFSVGLWGDLPYSDEQKAVGVPNLIADMNAQPLAFSVFDGDLKSGRTPCDDAVFTDAAARLNSLEAPAVYVPGDNEWTDCHRINNGGHDPLERLATLRATLFASPFSFGQRKLRLHHQGEVGGVAYPENTRWSMGGVVFAALHVVGSDNNRVPDPDVAEPASVRDRAARVAAQEEYLARDAATRAWLVDTFEEARTTNAPAVVLVMQANPIFDSPDTPADERAATVEDGFTALHRTLREQVLAYGRPVLLVHGDSHYFRLDKPLEDADGRRVERFTRLETFGETDVHWVRLRVNPRSREVFSFQPRIVPANVVTGTPAAE